MNVFTREMIKREMPTESDKTRRITHRIILNFASEGLKSWLTTEKMTELKTTLRAGGHGELFGRKNWHDDNEVSEKFELLSIDWNI